MRTAGGGDGGPGGCQGMATEPLCPPAQDDPPEPPPTFWPRLKELNQDSGFSLLQAASRTWEGRNGEAGGHQALAPALHSLWQQQACWCPHSRTAAPCPLLPALTASNFLSGKRQVSPPAVKLQKTLKASREQPWLGSIQYSPEGAGKGPGGAAAWVTATLLLQDHRGGN